jgi:hypothetical protein
VADKNNKKNKKKMDDQEKALNKQLMAEINKRKDDLRDLNKSPTIDDSSINDRA